MTGPKIDMNRVGPAARLPHLGVIAGLSLLLWALIIEAVRLI
jgi:hypothetical protein